MRALEDAVAAVRSFARYIDGKRCPASIEGEWREDKSLGDGLCALIAPLGVPKLACPIVDAVRTELAIACDDDGRGVTIVDKTTLSSANETRVRFDGGEVEKTTRGGRKKFMLSGDARGAEGEELVVTCRLFQRGDGWKTEQIRKLMDDGTLRERNVLVRPNEPDVVVDRFFRRKDDGK